MPRRTSKVGEPGFGGTTPDPSRPGAGDSVPIPQISGGDAGNPWGNSAATYGGTSISEVTPKGYIDRDTLNQTSISDVVEFNRFEETIKDFILSRLGHPVVRVELTPYQIKTCIDEAVTRFSYHAPLWTMQMTTFDASAGQNLYKIPTFIIDNLEYVVYKKTLLTIQQKSGTLEFDFFIKYFQDNFLFQNFAVGDFYMLQQNLEQLRKILGQEGSWNVLNNQYLQLYPTPVTTPQSVVLVFRAIDTNTMHPAYRNWVQRYALALTKGVLGEIRGKYATLPSPGGGASLNGDALKQESVAEKTALIEELLGELEEPPSFTMF